MYHGYVDIKVPETRIFDCNGVRQVLTYLIGLSCLQYILIYDYRNKTDFIYCKSEIL